MSLNLNLGGGYKRYEGYINVDYDSNTNPEVHINLDDENLILPFEDNSVDNIKAFHILEHIGSGYFKLLQELYRVSKHGSLIEIQVPHPFHEYYLNDPTHKRPITVEGLRLFSKKYNIHTKEQFSSNSCLGIFFNVDFEIVEYAFIYDPFYQEIFRRNSQEQNIRLTRECVNICTEIHVTLVVVKE